MKRTLLFLMFLSLFSCEKKEIDYSNQLFLNENQTYQLLELNDKLLSKIELNGDLDMVISEIEVLDKSFENIKNDLIWVCGGYKDSISGEIANQTKSFYTEKYFYRKNYARDYAINNFLDQIYKWDELFIENKLESLTKKSFNSYNKWFKTERVSLKKVDLFRRLKPIEALILISTIQRQLQVEKYNLLVKEIEKQ